MKVTRTKLAGVLVIEPRVHADHRGGLFETWQSERYAACGVVGHFVQDNVASSHKDVLRGLHFQWPSPQGKLVTALHGEILDVAVDVVPDSPTFGEWVAVELTGDRGNQLWMPVGYAHGYLVLSDHATVHYKCTDLYSPGSERSVLYSDPRLRIDWGTDSPIVSAKDASAPLLSEIPAEHLPAIIR